MVNLARIGIGTWPLGGDDWSHGWGPQEEIESEETLAYALAQGLTQIDTAPVYGLGRSERIVGRAVRRYAGPKPLVATKCGQVWDSSGRIKANFTPESIRSEINASLVRMNVEQLDLVYLHYPSSDIEETMNALAEMTKLVRQGKIARIGVSNFGNAEIEDASKNFDLYACQAKYSMLSRQVEAGTIELCRKKNIKFVAYQPLESGLLTGTFFGVRKRILAQTDWRTRNLFFRDESIALLRGLNDVVATIAHRHDTSIAAVALQWVLQNSDCKTVLVGMRSIDQVSESLNAASFELTAEDMEEIQQSLSLYHSRVNVSDAK
jgi:aryl-alcohol dehydrogenase-like predicted oxidoreductase